LKDDVSLNIKYKISADKQLKYTYRSISIKTSFSFRLTISVPVPLNRVGHIALDSASPQVRKLFFLAPQRKLRSSKAQLRSLRFKILGATLNRNFYQ
jgi:hypothetical protein